VAINQNTEQKQQAAGSNGAGGGKESFQISAPSISLPRGGGAIRGIGEKFAANPVTGTGSMTVPIAVSPGRGGFGPQLSLSYDSGAQDCFLVKVYRDQVKATGEFLGAALWQVKAVMAAWTFIGLVFVWSQQAWWIALVVFSVGLGSSLSQRWIKQPNAIKT
jgi:hypothetical protein